MSREQLLEDGIKRLTSLLKAERASAHSQKVEKPDKPLKTGLTSLMASDKSISPCVVKPYQELSKGVKAGYEDHGGKNWAVLDFQPADLKAASSGDPTARGPRLGLHPVLADGSSTKWMTLEVEIEKPKREDFCNLRVTFLGEFSFAEYHEAMHINTVKVSLRGDQLGGNHQDLDIGFFPVTTIPMAHTIFCNEDRKLKHIFASSSSVQIIIWLPNYGKYKFNLYDLALGVA